MRAMAVRIETLGSATVDTRPASVCEGIAP
jgi:hypothetical protein